MPMGLGFRWPIFLACLKARCACNRPAAKLERPVQHLRAYFQRIADPQVIVLETCHLTKPTCPRSPRMHIEPQHRIYVCFFLFAVSMGAMLSRLPDLQDALLVDKSELGLTLIGAAIGALISLTLSSPLVARLGARATAFITVLGTSALLALVPWMNAAPLVFGLLICEGLLAGALEINLNVEIDRIEAQLGRGVMNRAHGFWSSGFLRDRARLFGSSASRCIYAGTPRAHVRPCPDHRNHNNRGHEERASPGRS